MPIITVSRGSYSRGKEIAEILAKSLGYECVSREILLEATGHFDIPEIKLVRAIHDAPSILERFTFGKEKYVAFFRAAFLKHVQRGDVVYHGLAGHFFLQGVPHALKVRVIAGIEARVREEMRREGISADDARHVLVKDDAERRRWSLHLYGIDTWDPALYDMVVQIGTMSVEDVAETILHAARRPCFQTSAEGQRDLDDLVLAAQVQAALVSDFPRVVVEAKDGEVIVAVRTPLSNEAAAAATVRRLAEPVEGVASVRVNVVPVAIRD